MRLFVYEYITGGGFRESALPKSLAREGRAMLRAVVEDLAEVSGVSVVTTVDGRLEEGFSARLPDRVELVVVRPRGEHRRDFDRLAQHSDGCLIIAPETDGVLLELTQRASAQGARVLGSSAEAIEAASDKLELPDRLAEHRIPCLRSVPCRRDILPPFPPPWVLKPRVGAGSTDTHLVSDSADPIDVRGGILTPYVSGLAASVLVLAGEGGVFPLAPGEQVLSSEGRFRYLGGKVPLPADLAGRATRLARRAIGAIPGLRGFVGVDLILGVDRKGDTVVEVNPRLTTSYVGLRALACENLAERWLDVVLGHSIGEIAWRDGEVHFSAGGEVRERAPACPPPPPCPA